MFDVFLVLFDYMINLDELRYYVVEEMLSKIILMMPKTQVKNQESSKFQESKSHSIK